jgi:alanine dehydrogenase
VKGQQSSIGQSGLSNSSDELQRLEDSGRCLEALAAGLTRAHGRHGMRIGVPKEIKRQEYRVGMTPASVRAYVKNSHEVLLEKGAGVGSGYEDSEYTVSGARILADKAEVFRQSEMIVKVKEPLAEEYALFREGQILYTYLHLAANRELAAELIRRKVTGLAYETIELPDRSLPCLTPMSEVAGRLAIQEGAKYLEKPFGGRGILLGGVPGVQRGKVSILGGGIVGTNACKIAVGIGANVTVLDINAKRLAYLDDIFGSSITTLHATEANVEMVLRESDIVVGAVLVPGETAPRLITRQHLSFMQPGAVIVDVAIDQGGSAETSKPTTHDDPIYIVDGIVHYCVANMPGAVARSSTIALTSVTLQYGLQIAGQGIHAAARASEAIRRGINTINGKCVHPGVAKSCGLPYAEYAG